MTNTPIYDQVAAIRAYTTGVLRARREYELRPFADGHKHPGPNDTPTELSVAPDTITTTRPHSFDPGGRAHWYMPRCKICGRFLAEHPTPTQPEPETQP